MPLHFPKMSFPDNNYPTADRIALGKQLFFDKSLSLDSSIACSSCHLPELAFTDGKSISLGVGGRRGKRNAPTLLNAGYLDLINKDGGVKKLDLQALVPIEDENEMAIPILTLSERLAANEHYQNLSQKAYGQEIGAFSISRSLASFVRSLVSYDSPYDRYLSGDGSAMSDAAIRGMKLFESKKLNCSTCHGGFNFTNNAFENNGLYAQYQDLGRALITLDSFDRGKFRVPSLRNVAVTAPYMHDGTIPSLEGVIQHYEQVHQVPNRRPSDHLSDFTLSDSERSDLLSFLEALTDWQFRD